MMSVVKRRSSIYDARIAGLYDLEQTIGRGHFAVVKLARHVFTGEKVAVKVIDKTKLDPLSKDHLMQEVRCMKLVQHPNIVRLYEVIDTQTKLFLILELGDYDMYDFIMKDDSKIPEHQAQSYFCQIVEAINYCHTLRVVHRDLKPENVVFFEKLGMVKLTDFGFSNLFTPGQQLETSCGSLAYSAPEILLGDSYDAPAVDVWSLGVILYMLMVGRLPFQEANDSETLTKILDCKYALPDHLSQGCKMLIGKMLVRDPSRRATLKDIVEDEWVRAGDLGHAQLLPLISREQVSEEAHQLIIEQMVSGGIAENEDIHRALEKDEYNYQTATYYLLAERVLKKEREEQARGLLETNAKSDSQLEMASLALSPRILEKSHRGMTVICTCSDDSELCACVQAKLSHSSGQGKEQVQGLVSPVSKNPPTPSPWAIPTASSNGSSGLALERNDSWRQRTCSIVKEESEDELSSYLKTSRGPSPAMGVGQSPANSVFGSSPGRGHSSPLPIQELQELSARLSGRATPERGSRSPSPGGSGRTSPVVIRYKGLGSGSLRKLSSSPHLLGICEEREEDGGLSVAEGVEEEVVMTTVRPPPTYSSVRMIRPRQAVVSPDVIRRYERVYGSGGRSRRSTSCSSSEASDDDSERRLNLICSRTCRKDGSDHDDEADPPCGGGRGHSHRCIRGKITMSKKSGESGSSDGGRGPERRENGNQAQARQLDARKLIGKLQKLVLAPIREVPTGFFPRFLARRWADVLGPEDGFKQLQKPKSCESLHRIHKTDTPDANNNVPPARNKAGELPAGTGVGVQTDDDLNDAEDESTALDREIRHKGKRRKHKRCRASACHSHFHESLSLVERPHPVLG